MKVATQTATQGRVSYKCSYNTDFKTLIICFIEKIVVCLHYEIK